MLPSHLPTKGCHLAAIIITRTPGKRQGPTVTHGSGQVYVAGGRQDAPGRSRTGGVKAKGKPGFIRGKLWGVNLSLGLPALPGRAKQESRTSVPDLVQVSPVELPNPEDFITQAPSGVSTQNQKELQVAAKAKADNAARVMRVGLAVPPPHRIACYY